MNPSWKSVHKLQKRIFLCVKLIYNKLKKIFCTSYNKIYKTSKVELCYLSVNYAAEDQC